MVELTLSALSHSLTTLSELGQPASTQMTRVHPFALVAYPFLSKNFANAAVYAPAAKPGQEGAGEGFVCLATVVIDKFEARNLGLQRGK